MRSVRVSDHGRIKRMKNQHHMTHRPDLETASAQTQHYLPFFPTAYPDETLRSRCTRYHITIGHRSLIETYRDLFGSNPFQLSNILAHRILVLSSRLPGDQNANAKRMMHESTLMPLISLFSAKARRHHRLATIQDGNEETWTTKICTDCIKEDLLNYELPYLRRSHQLSISTVCWQHGIRLIEKCPICSYAIGHPLKIHTTPWTACICGFSFHEFDGIKRTIATHVELQISKFAYTVLNELPIDFKTEYLGQALWNRAIETGLFWNNRKYSQRSLITALEKHYTTTFLKKVDRDYANKNTLRWLRFVRKTAPTTETPITRKILLAGFLFEEGKSFLDYLTQLNDQTTPPPEHQDFDIAHNLQIAKFAESAPTKPPTQKDLGRISSSEMQQMAI